MAILAWKQNTFSKNIPITIYYGISGQSPLYKTNFISYDPLGCTFKGRSAWVLLMIQEFAFIPECTQYLFILLLEYVCNDNQTEEQNFIIMKIV